MSKEIKARITVACVTDQFSCDRIINAGKKISDISGSELHVLSVMNPRMQNSSQALEYLFSVSKRNGAVMNVLYSDRPLKRIVDYIRENRVGHVVTGLPGDNVSLLYDLYMRFPEIVFFSVGKNGEISPVSSGSLSNPDPAKSLEEERS